MPGTRKRVPRPDSYRALMDRCDALARQRAYTRRVCEIDGCGRTRAAGFVLEWAHGFSRGYHFLRHLDANGRLLCRGHHTYYSDKGRSEDWREWLREKLGDHEFDEMRRRRNDRCDVPHLQRVLAVLESGRPCDLGALDSEAPGALLDSQQPALAGRGGG